MDELVFAVPAAEIRNLLAYKDQGFIPGDSNSLNKIVSKGFFGRRGDLEDDPSCKQLIPYAVISHLDSFFLFRRRSGQREKRLQDLYSLGVGGHMNPGSETRQGEEYVLDQLKRELHEELRFSDGCKIEDIEFAGYIIDDTIPVSRVHMGLLYMVRVSGRDIHAAETDKMTAAWVERSRLAEFYEGMETWTRIVYDSLICK